MSNSQAAGVPISRLPDVSIHDAHVHTVSTTVRYFRVAYSPTKRGKVGELESDQKKYIGVTGWGAAPGDTLQGADTRRKKNFVGKFTKKSGETRSDR